MLAAVAAEQYTEEVEIIRIISGRVIFAHINNNIVFYIYGFVQKKCTFFRYIFPTKVAKNKLFLAKKSTSQVTITTEHITE